MSNQSIIDAAYSGTQKCLGCPPGLAPVTFGPKALEAMDARTSIDSGQRANPRNPISQSKGGFEVLQWGCPVWTLVRTSPVSEKGVYILPCNYTYQI